MGLYPFLVQIIGYVTKKYVVTSKEQGKVNYVIMPFILAS